MLNETVIMVNSESPIMVQNCFLEVSDGLLK